MTKREIQALARIIAEHEMAIGTSLAEEANQGIPFPDQLKGCAATDDRILREVLGLDKDGAERFRHRAWAWYNQPDIFNI